MDLEIMYLKGGFRIREQDDSFQYILEKINSNGGWDFVGSDDSILWLTYRAEGFLDWACGGVK